MNFHWSRGTRSLKWNQFTSSFNDNNLGNWKFIIQIPGNSNCQSGSLEWTSFTLKRKQLNATNGSQCEPGFLQQSSCFTFVQTRITACSAKPTTEREREMWDTCSGKKKPPSPPSPWLTAAGVGCIHTASAHQLPGGLNPEHDPFRWNWKTNFVEQVRDSMLTLWPARFRLF